jgi:geranylgeranyl diphosphate synthase type II
MGKNVGADAREGKMSYPAVLGLKRSKEIQRDLVDLAVQSLVSFDHRSDPLRYIARYIIERKG